MALRFQPIMVLMCAGGSDVLLASSVATAPALGAPGGCGLTTGFAALTDVAACTAARDVLAGITSLRTTPRVELADNLDNGGGEGMMVDRPFVALIVLADDRLVV